MYLTEHTESGLTQELTLGPAQEAKPIPDGLVSLWDMINYNLNNFILALAMIKQLREVAAYHANSNREATLAKEHIPTFQESFAIILPPLHAFDLSIDRLTSLYLLVQSGGFYRDIEHELKALDSDIQSYAKRVHFYHYPKDKALLLLNAPRDWAATLASFPAACKDVLEAVDCYALEHNNASIYHSMRLCRN